MDDSGYDRESGDYNSTDCVEDANGMNLVCQMNGESVGDPFPCAEADCRMMAAAPDMYRELYDDWRFCKWLLTTKQPWLVERAEKRIKSIENILTKASCEEENQDV